MIRINLLAVERERTKKKSTFLTGQKVTIACSLVLVLALVTIGWRYLLAQQRIEAARHRHRELAAGSHAAARDHPAGPGIRAAEGAIAAARGAHRAAAEEPDGTGPHAGPDQPLAAAERCGSRRSSRTTTAITIDGRCTSLTALSDFVANLEATGYFKKSVEILSSQLETPAATGGSGGREVQREGRVHHAGRCGGCGEGGRETGGCEELKTRKARVLIRRYGE